MRRLRGRRQRRREGIERVKGVWCEGVALVAVEGKENLRSAGFRVLGRLQFIFVAVQFRSRGCHARDRLTPSLPHSLPIIIQAKVKMEEGGNGTGSR